MAATVTNTELVRRQDSQIHAMLSAGMKQVEIAESLGISKRTVIRAVQRLRPDLELVDQKLSEVQRQLKKQMPIRERVEKLVEVARTSELDFARIGSIKYLNELDGIHPQLEREKARREREQPQTAPMFMLPAGTTVNVTVNQSVSAPADTTTCGNEGRIIDVETQETP